MTYYLKEITRIKNNCFFNQGQIDTVIGTRHFINNNYDKELNLNLLSHIRFTSKFHLIRLYKRYYGQTPGQYLIGRRLEKAKDLLREGQSVTGTCFDIGFESPSSFSTLFKSKFGLTPTEFQKRAIFTKSDKQEF
ncbi:AraC family transcriptional regulator [Sporocytophaga myxococcoides]|uniref:AraC family transcriptional regulator n=1 Tax=Sporocytophaga myxococcoides TaxID=153721 RepID=A0A098LAK5_9BACT|nr:AraC family transcriptional regulator [Sporocytophaga myxococcoides]GAL83986.1 AraC family transcriptional regulator [Sporocytophaga myxococcoides]